MTVLKYFLLSVGIALYCGCTPEEVFVLVQASELQKAASGQLGHAQVELVFEMQNVDDPEFPNKIRRAALPYLGEGAVIELEKQVSRTVRSSGSLRDQEEEVELNTTLKDAKLVARFTIPVGTPGVLQQTGRSVMWLQYTPQDKTFRLVNGNAIQGLNSSLATVGDGVSYDYDGGYAPMDEGTTIKIVNDETITVGVAAVEVNGSPVIAKTLSTEASALKIDYNNNFYNGNSPCFVYGAYQELTPVRLKKDSL